MISVVKGMYKIRNKSEDEKNNVVVEADELPVTKEDASILHMNANVEKVLESISRSIRDTLKAIHFYDGEEKVIEMYKKFWNKKQN